MATDKSKLDPSAAMKAKLAGEKAMEDILSQSVLDALMNLTPDQIREIDTSAESVKGTAKPPSVWVHSPARFEFNAASDKRMTRISGWVGMPVTQVSKVKPRHIEGTKLVVINPASENDHTAVEVTRSSSSSSAWVNLWDLLGPVKLTVETGYRVRYNVAYVPKGSPLWPGLVIDLSQPKERKQEPVAKKNSGTNTEEQEQQAGAQATTKETKKRGRKKGTGDQPSPTAPEPVQAAPAPAAPGAESADQVAAAEESK